MVFALFVTDWRFAACPTRRSPDAGKPTIDGVVRAPSALWMTRMSTFDDPGFVSTTATHELVVPRSIPMTFDIESAPPEVSPKVGRPSPIFLQRRRLASP